MSAEIKTLWKGRASLRSKLAFRALAETQEPLWLMFPSLIPEIERNVEGVKVEKEEDADPSVSIFLSICCPYSNADIEMYSG